MTRALSLDERSCKAGPKWHATLSEIAGGADILITMLPGSREVREVMAGSDVLAAMPSTAVWVDMTSTAPRPDGNLPQPRGPAAGVLDASVGGGVPAARAGTLQVSVGGDAAVLDRCRVVPEALADPQRIIRVGGNGAGYTAKLLVNLLWFGQAAATGQALLLRFKSVSNTHPSRTADRLQAPSPLRLAGPAGGMGRRARFGPRGFQPLRAEHSASYDESGRPWPHNRVVVSSAVAMLRGNVRSITLTPAAQASGEWHGSPTLPAQFKALRG